MSELINSVRTVSTAEKKMAVKFEGLKCPVCGKNLIKVRANSLSGIKIQALMPDESEKAVASVKCPVHGGAVPIRIISGSTE